MSNSFWCEKSNFQSYISLINRPGRCSFFCLKRSGTTLTASKGTVINSHLFHLCYYWYKAILNTNILLHLVFDFSLLLVVLIVNKNEYNSIFPLQVMSYHDDSNVWSLLFSFIFLQWKAVQSPFNTFWGYN